MLSNTSSVKKKASLGSGKRCLPLAWKADPQFYCQALELSPHGQTHTAFSHQFHQNKTVLWFLVINSLQKLITVGTELTTSCISEILLSSGSWLHSQYGERNVLPSCGFYPQMLCWCKMNPSALQVELKSPLLLFQQAGDKSQCPCQHLPSKQLHSNAQGCKQTAAACKCTGTFTCVFDLLCSSGTRGVQGCRERLPFRLVQC